MFYDQFKICIEIFELKNTLILFFYRLILNRNNRQFIHGLWTSIFILRLKIVIQNIGVLFWWKVNSIYLDNKRFLYSVCVLLTDSKISKSLRNFKWIFSYKNRLTNLLLKVFKIYYFDKMIDNICKYFLWSISHLE